MPGRYPDGKTMNGDNGTYSSGNQRGGLGWRLKSGIQQFTNLI